MKLPTLEHPDRYTGLYVIDFHDTCAVGYTAEEVAMLAESEAYAHVKIYRIYAAMPDGTMELVGVSHQKFQLETGLFFYSLDLEAARRDYDKIHRLADGNLPCRTQLLLGGLGEKSRLPFVVGLAYPAEYDEDVSRWMLDNEVAAGAYADGGVGRLESIRRDARVIDSAQLHAIKSRRTRTRREVFASVGEPIQRTA